MTSSTTLFDLNLNDSYIKEKLIRFLKKDPDISVCIRDEVEGVTITEAAMAAGYNFDVKGPNRDYIGALGAYARPRLDHLTLNPFKNVHAPHIYPANHPKVIAVIAEFCRAKGIKPSKNNTYKVDNM